MQFRGKKKSSLAIQTQDLVHIYCILESEWDTPDFLLPPLLSNTWRSRLRIWLHDHRPRHSLFSSCCTPCQSLGIPNKTGILVKWKFFHHHWVTCSPLWWKLTRFTHSRSVSPGVTLHWLTTCRGNSHFLTLTSFSQHSSSNDSWYLVWCHSSRDLETPKGISGLKISW